MMERWDKLPIIIKRLIIITIPIIISFSIGFNIAMSIEQNRLKSLCSSVLNIEKSDVNSVKVTDEEVLIKLESYKDNIISTKDNSIYDYFDSEYILELKDNFLGKDISIN